MKGSVEIGSTLNHNHFITNIVLTGILLDPTLKATKYALPIFLFVVRSNAGYSPVMENQFKLVIYHSSTSDHYFVSLDLDLN